MGNILLLIVFILVQLYFVFLLVKFISKIRTLTKLSAKCFNPLVDKFKDAKRIMEGKYKEAKGYVKLNTGDAFVILQIILKYNPGSVTTLVPVSHLLPKEVIDKFNYGKENGFFIKTESDRIINDIIFADFKNSYYNKKQDYVNDKKDFKIPIGYKMPDFRYMPHPEKCGKIFENKKTICDVCNKNKNMYFELSGKNNINCCPNCLKDGGVKKLLKNSINNYESCILKGDKKVLNPNYIEEFEYRTPQYASVNNYIWLTHCDNFCAYIGRIYWSDIQKFGQEIKNQIMIDYVRSGQEVSVETIMESMEKNSKLIGHLFQCVNCKKYRLYTEID